jgi:hypothetical protein
MIETPSSRAPALVRALDVTGGSALLDRTWWSWAGPQGGLLAAIALRRAGQLAAGREPSSSPSWPRGRCP